MKGCKSSIPEEKPGLICTEQNGFQAFSPRELLTSSSPGEEGSVSLQAAPCPYGDGALLVVLPSGAQHHAPGCGAQLVPGAGETTHRLPAPEQKHCHSPQSGGRTDIALKAI